MLENMLILNWWVATGVLCLEVVTFGLIIYFGFLKISLTTTALLVKKWGTAQNILILFFVFSLSSSTMTLVYSEYFGVIPCALCWFERVFMYGIVLISGTAIFARNTFEQKGILRYFLVFSFLGAFTSFYHHVLQMTASLESHLPCPASGGDCAKRLIFEYDHITFPWMAFVLFTFFIVTILLSKKLNKE